MIHEIERSVRIRCFNRPATFKKEIARSLDVKEEEVNYIKVLKKSLDARGYYPMYHVQMKVYTGTDKYETPYRQLTLPTRLPGKSVVVCGAGPAGLFAAYTLAMSGCKPILLERGKDIHRRKKDVGLLCQEGIVNPESNYCFGEGGAGCFSDGKLYTRSNKRGDVQHILDVLVHFGADPSICYEAHPHIGSDCLPGIIEKMRNALIIAGGEVHFETRVDDFILDKANTCVGVVDQNGKEYRGAGVIIACGHSAENIYQWFYKHQYAIQGKDWAMGVRIEHPQEVIDLMQYRKPAASLDLPPAEYGFANQVEDRGVFSFCMCPGGMIIPSMTTSNRFLVNGMSGSDRSSPWANSGVIVTVRQSDADMYKEEYGPLSGLKYQQLIEERFSVANQLKAPAQKLVDFLKNEETTILEATSYPLGVWSAPLHEMLPSFMVKALQTGISEFGRKKPSYICEQAMLVGLESRTSSTVVLPRNTETLEHIQIKHLYPCGEGAGYAGGITSSAIDGVNCAQKLLWNLKREIVKSMNL